MIEYLDNIVWGILGVATYFGTFRNNSGIPLIYNKINGKNYGLVIGFVNEIEEGSHVMGGNIAIGTKNAGRIDGVNLNAVISAGKGNSAEVNGIEASGLLNLASEGHDLATKINGLQCATIFSLARPGKLGVLQAGFFDRIEYESFGRMEGGEGQIKKSLFLNIGEESASC